MERPVIKDYFKEDITIGEIQQIYVGSPELYSYMAAQDQYIDWLEQELTARSCA